MHKPIVIVASVVIVLSAIGAGATAAKLTDPQIVHIVYTADNTRTPNRRSTRVRMKRCGHLRTE